MNFIEVKNLSDKILFLKKGKVVHFNTLEEIKSCYLPVLKIKNSHLTLDKLKNSGLAYSYKKDVFEVKIAKDDDLEMVSILVDKEESEIYQLEQPNLERIFTEVNMRGK